MKKIVFLFLSILGLFLVGPEKIHADTVQFSMYVNRSDLSASSPAVKKSDWESAVANILGGLGGGRSVNIRVRTDAEGEAATYMYEAHSNARYTLGYMDGYGTKGRYYRLNASKLGWLDTTINGRFAP